MRTGISLYMGSGLATNIQIIDKAHAAGASFAFTSLQIPEETDIDQASETRRLLQLCREANLNLIADISPRTLAKLGYSSLSELKGTGIDYVRLDFGFSAAETVELSHDFHVVFNASTISKQDILAWRSAGADFTRFAACHNYYPKPLTGLSIERVANILSLASQPWHSSQATRPYVDLSMRVFLLSKLTEVIRQINLQLMRLNSWRQKQML